MYLISKLIILILTFLPRLLPRAIVRSVLSAQWIQIVLRQQDYNPVDIKLAILDFAKFALFVNREEPSSFSSGNVVCVLCRLSSVY